MSKHKQITSAVPAIADKLANNWRSANLSRQQQRMREDQAWYLIQEAETRMLLIMPAIEQVLWKQGLELDELRFYPSFDRLTKELSENPGTPIVHTCSVSIDVAPLNGKFRFLTNTGRYTASGNSTNHEARRRKADKLREAFAPLAQDLKAQYPARDLRVSVNEFSLELHRGETNKSIMIGVSF